MKPIKNKNMSILIMEPKIYNHIFSKMVDYSYSKTVNINYCYTFGKMTENEMQKFLVSLCVLNEQSYCDKYNDKFEHIYKFIKFRYYPGSISTYQMLKYILCIRYNIETCTIKRDLTEDENNHLKILDKGIEEIQMQIINSLPEYDNCEWSKVY